MESQTNPKNTNQLRLNFSTKSKVVPRQQQHNQQKVYKCDKCPNVYNASVAFWNHKKTHQRAMRYTCAVCDKPFREKSDRDVHLRIHTGEKPFSCKFCKRRFNSSGNLRKHERTHGDLKDTRYLCTFCGKFWRSKENLYTHILRHIKEKAIDCSFCDFSCIKPHELKSHISSIHKTQLVDTPSNVVCIMCEKSFARKSQLNEHLQRHTREKPFSCSTCRRCFCSKGELRIHIIIWHIKDRQHSCEICGKRFAFPSVLREHIRRHLGEKDYKCKICSKEFSSTGKLKIHEKVHHGGVKLYPCVLCDKRFYSRSYASYYPHLRMHTREKPHICNECDKEYALPQTLKFHQQTHNGVKPYECVFCSEKFTTRNGGTKHSLDQHLRNHIREESFLCDECRRSFMNAGTFFDHRRKLHR